MIFKILLLFLFFKYLFFIFCIFNITPDIPSILGMVNLKPEVKLYRFSVVGVLCSRPYDNQCEHEVLLLHPQQKLTLYKGSARGSLNCTNNSVKGQFDSIHSNTASSWHSSLYFYEEHFKARPAFSVVVLGFLLFFNFLRLCIKTQISPVSCKYLAVHRDLVSSFLHHRHGCSSVCILGYV